MKSAIFIAAVLGLLAASISQSADHPSVPATQAVGGSVITMHFKNAPLQDVLDDFAKQSGADLGAQRPDIIAYARNRRVDLNLDRADFWAAASALDDVSELSLDWEANRRWLQLQTQPKHASLAIFTLPVFRKDIVVSGPCAFLPDGVELHNRVDYLPGAAVMTNTINLRVNAAVEPRLHAIGLTSTHWLGDSIDENGHSLKKLDDDINFERGISWSFYLSGKVQQAPDMGTKIATLNGELHLKAQTKWEMLDINDLLQSVGSTMSAGGRSITIEKFVNHDKNFSLRLRLRAANDRDAPVPIKDMFSELQIRTSAPQNTFWLTDTDFATPTIVNGHREDEVTLTFLTTDGEIPSTVIKQLDWEVPLEIKEIVVPFELHDIPLLDAPAGE